MAKNAGEAKVLGVVRAELFAVRYIDAAGREWGRPVLKIGDSVVLIKDDQLETQLPGETPDYIRDGVLDHVKKLSTEGFKEVP